MNIEYIPHGRLDREYVKLLNGEPLAVDGPLRVADGPLRVDLDQSPPKRRRVTEGSARAFSGNGSVLAIGDEFSESAESAAAELDIEAELTRMIEADEDALYVLIAAKRRRLNLELW